MRLPRPALALLAAGLTAGCTLHTQGGGYTALQTPEPYGQGAYGGPGAPYGQPPGYPAPGMYPPGPNAAPQGGTQPPAPQPLPGQLPQPQAPQSPAMPGSYDPINAIDANWLRGEAGAVIGELINALAPAAQGRVQGIPFAADPTPGAVNAYAACDDQGLPLLAITDGLLEVAAFTAQLKATDELFGTHKLPDYQRLLVQSQGSSQPLARPPPGFIDPAQSADPRKVERQHALLDEQLAFVLGHELSHHYLGHTGCANGQPSRGVTPQALGRLLSRAMPVFNQPNEVAADVAGTNNLLTAGARRQGVRWNEEGAVLTLQFFATLDQLSPQSVFGFQNTHPHPLLRLPIVQQTANAWRLTGGQFSALPGLLGQ